MEIRRNPVYLVLAIMAVFMTLGLILLMVSTGSAPPPESAPAVSSTDQPTAKSGTPSAAPDPKAVEASESSTSLNIAVDDCDGCQITAQPTGGSVDLQPISATIADGTAKIDLPTSSTLGLVFSVRGEEAGEDKATSSLVVLSATDAQPGSAQSQAQLDKAGKGTYCWAGTLLDVAHVQFSISGDSAEPGAAWANPALPTTGGKMTLKNGSAAVPEKLDCS